MHNIQAITTDLEFMMRTLGLQEGVEIHRYMDKEHTEIRFDDSFIALNVYEIHCNIAPFHYYFDTALEVWPSGLRKICTHPISFLVKHIVSTFQRIYPT